MLTEIEKSSDKRMRGSIEVFTQALAKIRTGRANPALLDGILVPYHGSDTPLRQLGSITVEEARTLLITPWDKSLLPAIEKSLLKSDLGITPQTVAGAIRMRLPSLNEQSRLDLARQAGQEAEKARIAIRNIRRDSNNKAKALLKEKKIAENEERSFQRKTQKLTDTYIAEVDGLLTRKQAELTEM